MKPYLIRQNLQDYPDFLIWCSNVLSIPGPDREKHRAHFKISVLQYCRIHKQDTIQSHQGGPVDPVKKEALILHYDLE
jgi:hypothetical protein